MLDTYIVVKTTGHPTLNLFPKKCLLKREKEKKSSDMELSMDYSVRTIWAAEQHAN